MIERLGFCKPLFTADVISLVSDFNDIYANSCVSIS